MLLAVAAAGSAGGGGASSGVGVEEEERGDLADREMFLVKNAVVLDSAAEKKDRPGRRDRRRRPV